MINSTFKKFLYILGISLFALIIFVLLAIYPLINKIRVASYDYFATQETLTRLDKKEILLRELEKEYEEKKDNLLIAQEAFLSSEDAVGFISTLETIANQTGNAFEIKSASPSDSSDEEEASYIIFHISLWGNFSNLLRFLASIENSPYPPYRLTEIDALNIKRIRGERLINNRTFREGDLETVLSIKIYTK